MSDRTCSVPNCHRQRYCKTFCSAHYKRLRSRGDVQPDKPIEPRLVGIPVCTTAGCSSKIEGRGYCQKHYKRLMKHGSVEETKRLRAESAPSWIGDDAGYRGVHGRLRRTFGRAATHPCSDCGRQAEDWSYDHKDPGEGYDERGCPFSTDLSHYQPRCKKCHALFDERRFITGGWEGDGE